MNRQKIGWKSVAAVVSLIYVGVRLWRVADSCLWFDEIYSIQAAELSFAGLFEFVAKDLVHPPLYYIVLKGWISAFGDSAEATRLLSVAISALAIPPFLLLCRELKISRPAQAFALFLLAVNGSLIKYAQEVRMYSLFFALSIVSMWLFSRYFFRGKNFWLLTLINAAVVYTHYFGWLLITAEVMVILIFQRVKFRHILVMCAVDAAAFLPWAAAVWQAALSGAEMGQNIGWIERPGIVSSLSYISDLIEPFYFQQSSVEPTQLSIIVVPIIAVLAAAGIYYASTFARRIEREKTIVVSLLLIVPATMAFAASWVLPYSIWGVRHLIITFPAAAILSSILLMSIERKIIRWIASFVILAASVYAFSLRLAAPSVTQVWCAWSVAATQAADRGARNLYVVEDISAYQIWFALRERSPEVTVAKLAGVPGITEDTAYFLPRGFGGVRKVNIADLSDATVTLIYRAVDFDLMQPPVAPLIQRGYRVTRVSKTNATVENAFTVEMRRAF